VGGEVHGLIPKSGYKLRYEYRDHDAERRFEVDAIATQESPLCISGQILKGLKKPHDCPAFGKQCTPQTPMTSRKRSSGRWPLAVARKSEDFIAAGTNAG
jgi:hydrogenase expression/formation protein HypD